MQYSRQQVIVKSGCRHDTPARCLNAANDEFIKEKIVFSMFMCIYVLNDTHEGGNMRTNIIIDDALMAQALGISGFKTKKETVEEALKF